MKIPFFIQEFTDEMEEAVIHALRNESFVGGKVFQNLKRNLQDIQELNMQFQLVQEIVHYRYH